MQPENNQEVLNENSGQNKNVGKVEQNEDDQIAMETDENISNEQEDSERSPQHSNQNEVNNEGLQRQSAKQKGNKYPRLTTNQIAKILSMINKHFPRPSVNADMANEGAYKAAGVDEMQQVQHNDDAELSEEATGSPTVSDDESDVDSEILQDSENEGDLNGIVDERNLTSSQQESVENTATRFESL